MLYPRKEEKTLDEALFRNPSSEYRGTPFWAWNCKVMKRQIEEQTEDLRQMGMGGAHIHSRTGMNIPFMSEEFLDLVSFAHDRFAEKDMLTWLYDEDRWPSGTCGGMVTKDRKNRLRSTVSAAWYSPRSPSGRASRRTEGNPSLPPGPSAMTTESS